MNLLFSWRGAVLKVAWPESGKGLPRHPLPEEIALTSGVRRLAPGMLPRDRVYLSHFYDAIQQTLERDGEREQPILADTAMFFSFHSGSIDLAIERGEIGDCRDLWPEIDGAFIAAIGAGVQDMAEAVRGRLESAAVALSWALRVNHE